MEERVEEAEEGAVMMQSHQGLDEQGRPLTATSSPLTRFSAKTISHRLLSTQDRQTIHPGLGQPDHEVQELIEGGIV